MTGQQPIWTEDAIRQQVLYRDRLLLVVNKPAGMAVHPGPGGGESLEDWFPFLAFEHPRPPGLAHRLDRDTAGCLALGRSQKGLSRLGKLFEQRRVHKAYWAVVRGVPATDHGSVSLPLAKVSAQGGWKVIADKKNGQAAQTDWTLLGSSADGALSWLECRPRSGRTHQIRVHCQVMGVPLLGDPVYGMPMDRAPKQDHLPPDQRPKLRLGPVPMHLLARSLTIPLYADRDPICVEAPVPPHMQEALHACGWAGD